MSERYKHYKGNEYEMLFMATHTETREPMVVYRSLDEEQAVWVRPKSMFFGLVTLPNGETVPRFRKIG